ncbi:hypothetical protein HYFRA_00010336 [Hymenoscyphus fraxineus]|uniref:Uncharacterized protein n=1 Tax=Hymenoscyphus fraxineus TaxID=746836 RepID=A0A9N9KX33_9HELO|nr:hypothetical protein HYFRA_00010336 [Hymenoscyphus fraxineus]
MPVEGAQIESLPTYAQVGLTHDHLEIVTVSVPKHFVIEQAPYVIFRYLHNPPPTKSQITMADPYQQYHSIPTTQANISPTISLPKTSVAFPSI